jgi:hypothetical protein
MFFPTIIPLVDRGTKRIIIFDSPGAFMSTKTLSRCDIVLLGAIFCIGIFLCESKSAIAAVLNPGSIIVATESSGNLYQVDPVSGAASLISSDGLLFNPNHLLIDSQGSLLTAERGGAGHTAGIVRVNLASANQTLVTAMTFPVALDFDHSGKLIVGNSAHQLVQVDPLTGSQTLLTTLSGFPNVQDVDVDQQGRIIVLDFGVFNSGGGKILQYDPATGIQSTIATGGNLFNPSDLIIRPTGDFIVSNRLANSTSQILDINPTSGAQHIITTVASEGFISLQDQNTLLYADFNGTLSILKIDLTNGQSQNVSSFHFSNDIVGVAIVPEPSTIALLAIGAVGLVFASRR